MDLNILADKIVRMDLDVWGLVGQLTTEQRLLVRKLAIERGAKKIPTGLYHDPITGLPIQEV